MYSRLTPVLCLLALAPRSPAGEVPQISTLPESIQAGLEHHPGLKAVRLDWQERVHQVDVATGLPYPQVGFTHLISEVETRTGPQENIITVSQAIPWMGKLRLKGEMADAEATAAHHRYEAARLERIRDIADAWFDHAWRKRQYELLEERRDFLEADWEITLERVRSGGSQADSLKVHLQLDRTEDMLRELEQSLENSRTRLARSIGVEATEIGQPVLTEGWVRDFDSEDASPSDHPMVQALEARVNAASAMERLARKNGIPDPSIGLNYIDIGNGGDDAVGVMVGFKVPIWGRKNRAEREAAASSAAAARERAEEVRQELIEKLEVSRENLKFSLDRATRYRGEMIPDAEDVRQVTLTGFQAGELSITDVLDAEEVLLELKQVWWRSVADAGRNLIFLQTWAGEEPLTSEEGGK